MKSTMPIYHLILTELTEDIFSDPIMWKDAFSNKSNSAEEYGHVDTTKHSKQEREESGCSVHQEAFLSKQHLCNTCEVIGIRPL